MTTPVLNGQVIGEAQRAAQALLDRLLATTGTTFYQWVGLNAIATRSGTATRAEVERLMVDGLRVDPGIVTRTLDELTAARLVEGGSHTEAGRARHASIRDGIAAITARLYGDLPPEDLAVAGRVLTTVTARARAELDAQGQDQG